MAIERRELDLAPLKGRRIAVTRPASQAGALIEGLRDLGAEPVSTPTIRISDPPDPGALRGAIATLDRYDWLVFTSANGVERFWRELETEGREFPEGHSWPPSDPRRRRLSGRGCRPHVVPEEYVAEAVADALIAFGELAGRRVLLPRAAGARQVLPERLRAAGAEVDEVIAYESHPDRRGFPAPCSPRTGRCGHDHVHCRVDGSAFCRGDRHGVGGARVAVIGPITARAVRSEACGSMWKRGSTRSRAAGSDSRVLPGQGGVRARCHGFRSIEGEDCVVRSN